MLQYFLIWAGEKLNLVLKLGAQATITESEPNSNSSARLDVETNTAMARITFWNSGDMNAEIINVESEQITYSLNGTVSDVAEFDNEFRQFFETLGIPMEANTVKK